MKKNKNENDTIFLRPKNLNDYIGQEKIKNNLKVFISAAKQRFEVLDHILLYGAPGLGKTTLANVIANEMKARIKIINAPSIEKPGDIASIISLIEANDILFIDEIHRLPKNVEEIFYSVMEDYKLITISGNGMDAININIQIPPFTLIGATTRIGSLSEPFKNRFGIIEKIDFYSNEEIEKIIIKNSSLLKIKINKKAANLIASRSKGTPRIANHLLKRIRDFANVENKNEITVEIANNALKALKINDLGLSDVEINYLKTIMNRFKGGPVGIETISLAIGEEAINLEDSYEPYLIKLGFINRTQRGRIVTNKTYDYFEKNNIKY
ncbi:Holliday junction branch migration DNA helicase RuvB [bacterium]|nr:Holliday junction branch migration DNA helicase RuvB [bacterium]